MLDLYECSEVNLKEAIHPNGTIFIIIVILLRFHAIQSCHDWFVVYNPLNISHFLADFCGVYKLHVEEGYKEVTAVIFSLTWLKIQFGVECLTVRYQLN